MIYKCALYFVILSLLLHQSLVAQDDDYQKAKSFYKRAEFDSCVQIILDQIRSTSYPKNKEVALLNLLAKSHARNYRYSKAKKSFFRAINLNDCRSKDLRAEYLISLLGLCDTYSNESKVDSMVPLLSDLEARITINKNDKYLGNLLFQKGSYYLNSDAPSAKKYYRLALKNMNIDDSQLVALYLHFADLLIENNELDSGLYYTKRALSICKKHFSKMPC